jgi:hypothetical protein
MLWLEVLPSIRNPENVCLNLVYGDTNFHCFPKYLYDNV